MAQARLSPSLVVCCTALRFSGIAERLAKSAHETAQPCSLRRSVGCKLSKPALDAGIAKDSLTSWTEAPRPPSSMPCHPRRYSTIRRRHPRPRMLGLDFLGCPTFDGCIMPSGCMTGLENLELPFAGWKPSRSGDRWQKNTIARSISQRLRLADACLRGSFGCLTSWHHPNQEEITMCSLIIRKTPIVRIVRSRTKSKKRVDGNGRSQNLNVENESRCGPQDSLIVQDSSTNGIQSSLMQTQGTSVTVPCLQRFIPPSQKADRIYTNNSKEFIEACQDVQWNHDTSTPHRVRNERSRRKSRPQSERRNSCRTRAKWTTRSKVVLCDEMLSLHAQHARQDGRWQDSIREAIWPEV